MINTRGNLKPTFSREMFLTGIFLAFGGIASVVVGVPLVGYLLTPLFKPEPSVWRNVGKVDAFKVGETVEVKYLDPNGLSWAGSTTRAGAYLRRESESNFICFSMYCTHLGCPLHWLKPPADLFLCPCHGSAFYSDGTVAAGPAQKPMVQLPVRVHGGQVQVKTSAIPVA